MTLFGGRSICYATLVLAKTMVFFGAPFSSLTWPRCDHRNIPWYTENIFSYKGTWKLSPGKQQGSENEMNWNLTWNSCQCWYQPKMMVTTSPTKKHRNSTLSVYDVFICFTCRIGRSRLNFHSTFYDINDLLCLLTLHLYWNFRENPSPFFVLPTSHVTK